MTSHMQLETVMQLVLLANCKLVIEHSSLVKLHCIINFKFTLTKGKILQFELCLTWILVNENPVRKTVILVYLERPLFLSSKVASVFWNYH